MSRLVSCAVVGAVISTALGCGDYRPPNANDEPAAPATNIDAPLGAKRSGEASTDGKPPQVGDRTVDGLGKWVRGAHPADDFTFAMPGRAERSANNLDTPNGRVSVVTHMLNTGEVVFLAMATEYSDEFLRNAGLSAEQVLARGLETIVAERAGAALLDRTPQEVAGLPAIDQMFTYPEGVNRSGGEYPAGIMFHRAMRDGRKVYLLQVDASQKHYDAHGDELFAARREFFDSFQRKR